jgi:glyoxylase-like metal-dependent hydrolase (beta-lactamase superfamily II)
MPAFICETCGSQFTPSEEPPPVCPICQDERQFVPPGGQRWTTLARLAHRHFNCFREHEPGLIGIGTEPKLAIGQRAILLRAPDGNILWDCITFIDRATIEIVKGLGGLSAIAISHPHYYSSMVEWSRALGGAPIYLHAADRHWIMRPDPAIKLWEGDTLSLARGATLIRCGGHFTGGTVLHWESGGEGRGALLPGDIVQVIPDCNYVSFMRSYPNLVPLSAAAVARIGSMLEPFSFDVIYGAFFDRVVLRAGKEAVKRSVARYIAIIESDGTGELA